MSMSLQKKSADPQLAPKKMNRCIGPFRHGCSVRYCRFYGSPAQPLLSGLVSHPWKNQKGRSGFPERPRSPFGNLIRVCYPDLAAPAPRREFVMLTSV